MLLFHLISRVNVYCFVNVCLFIYLPPIKTIASILIVNESITIPSMDKLQTEAAVKACIANDVETLQHIIPSLLPPNARIQQIRIHERPGQTVPILCVCAAYGSTECFEYMIEKGATSYYADVNSLFFWFLLDSI
jgi:hypothetical protein